jgi:hypothetical protein
MQIDPRRAKRRGANSQKLGVQSEGAYPRSVVARRPTWNEEGRLARMEGDWLFWLALAGFVASMAALMLWTVGLAAAPF